MKWLPGAICATTLLTLATLPAQRNRRGQPGQVWKYLAAKYDKNKDGKIAKDEYDRGAEKFAAFDSNGDGVLTEADWSAGRRRTRRRGGARRPAAQKLPQRGDPAPDFDIPFVKDSKKTVRLSSFAGKRPVALIFGSYT